MKTKTVYQTSNGIYIGEAVAHESPLEPGVFHIPGGCVEVQPPLLSENQKARWTGKAWEVETLPKPEAKPEPTPEDLAAQELVRKLAEAHAYLYQTDWYVIRKLERDIDIPFDVSTKRLESVEFINANE